MNRVSSGRFYSAFYAARTASTQVADATSEWTWVDGTRYFLSTDRKSGYAIQPDGELLYVFSLVKGRGEAIVADAITNGADHLNCF